MPLLENLQTDLTSLKYAPEGRIATEPFITVDIAKKIADDEGPTIDQNGSDLFLKSGVIERVINDEKRFFKYFQSPSGLRFIAKQNALSRSQVKSQASGLLNDGIYLPTSTLAQLAVNPTGGHLNKQGLNPFANTQTPNVANPNFLQKLSGFQGIPAYSKIVNEVKDVSTNRLLQLKDKKIAAPIVANQAPGVTPDSVVGFNIPPSNNNIFDKIGNGITDIIEGFKGGFISPYKTEIASYGGGPGSVLGVGKTRLRRYTTTVTLGSGGEIGVINDTTPKLGNGFMTLNANQITSIKQGIPLSNLPGLIGTSATEKVIDFRKAIIEADPAKPLKASTILSKSPDYTTKMAYGEDGRVNLGDPGSRKRNRISYTSSSIALDKINAMQIYKSQFVTQNPIKDDFVKFRFGIIQNSNPSEKVFIHFRALLDEFSDNYTAEWTGQKYMGRGENFYRYGGFDRQINMSFTVAALSKAELIPMYQKLNYLASTLAPDYTSQGYMAGNLVTLTLGGYCYEQPGFISTLNISPMMEAPIEIAINDEGNSDSSVKELFHIIQVSGVQFTPIHNFVPQVQKNVFAENGSLESFGKEQFIALTNGASNNYANTRPFDPTDPSKIQNETEDATASEQNVNNAAPNNTNESQGGNQGGIGDTVEQDLLAAGGDGS
jgi:hypothetical protein